MAAGFYNITAEQGATFSLLITWLDQNSNPINVTGYTADMQVRSTTGSPGTLEIELSTSNGRITLGGVAGTITLSISATDTGALPDGDYDYDLFLTSAGGVVSKLVRGVFTIIKRVSQ